MLKNSCLPMKDLRAVKGGARLAQMIAEGEHERQDFKFAISDARKIARTLSAFANNSGGRLLIGVKDNGVVAGVRNDEDLYMVESAAQIYCSPPRQVDFKAYRTREGEVVMVAEIAPSDVRPVKVREADGTLRAYYRVDDENISAPPLLCAAWEHKCRSAGESLSLSDAESALLRALSEGSLTVERLTVATHGSRRGVEKAIVRLYAMGVIEFTHSPDGWLIALKE